MEIPLGKSAPSPPAAPDPNATAAAQGAINRETAITQAELNRINQYGPQGSSIYNQTGTKNRVSFNEAGYNEAMQQANAGQRPHPGREEFTTNVETPIYEHRITYSPEQQRLYNLQTQGQEKLGVTANEQLGRLQSSLNTPLNYDGLPDVGEYAGDRQRTEEALYGRINPQLENDRAALEQRLANQGIAIGSQAYSSAMGDYGRQANDARYGAIMNAGQEQARLVAQAMARRQQGIQERTALRSQPLNEISALMSGSQVSNPQFNNVPQVQVNPADITGPTALQYQGKLAQYNAHQQSNNAMMGGLFGLGGAAADFAGGPGSFMGYKLWGG